MMLRLEHPLHHKHLTHVKIQETLCEKDEFRNTNLRGFKSSVFKYIYSYKNL